MKMIHTGQYLESLLGELVAARFSDVDRPDALHAANIRGLQSQPRPGDGSNTELFR